MRDSIGNFRLLQPIGEGAAGQVYLATPIRDTAYAKAGDPLAVKVYKEDILRQPKQLDRIRREFKVGSQVIHPNLVRIHELHEGETDEPPYLVMEWVDGVSLESWISMFHPVSSEVLLQIVEQLASGLAELHSNGVTHRDLKPANIMISASFDAKIMDFGVVHVPTDSPITPPDKFLGTIRNSSPELLNGDEYDHTTDLYSLGTVIYNLLYNEQVYEDETQFVRLIARVKESEPSYAQYGGNRDQVCAGLLVLTKKLLKKDPRERPQSVAEVQAALAPLSATRNVSPKPLHGYIGTALTGLEEDAREHINFASSKIAEVAKQHGLYVYQPRKATDPILHHDVEPSAVYKLDRKRVVSADLLLVLLNKPSFGVGQELEIAASYGTPTLLISREGVAVSRMVSGSPANFVDHIIYTTPEDLEKKLHKSLESVLPAVRSWTESTAKLRTQTGLGTRLRELRQRCGYSTPSELAAAIGMAPQLLALVEAGDLENLGVQVLERICNALEVTLPEILAGPAVPVGQRERDPNLLRLEDIAKRLNWPCREFFALRDDYGRQLAAKGEAESISEDQWLKRRDALERRTLEATKMKPGVPDDQPRLL